MIRRHVLSLALLALFALPLAAQKRSSVVLGAGEEAIYTTDDSIATVSSPPGTNQPPDQLVLVSPQQYGNTIRLRGLKKGEVKLLVESTAQRITEIVTVTVLDKAVAESYRRAIGALSGIDGISPETIFASATGVLITGTTYSQGDATRCSALETAAKAKSAITCAARPHSATGVIIPNTIYTPVPSISLREEIASSAGEAIPGSEGTSSWIAEVRLGDVPFAVLSAPRSVLVDQCIAINAKLRRAIAEWKREAERNRVYPTIVKSRRTTKGYELAMQWRLDQGTRGETLTELTFDEMQHALTKSGTTTDRLAEWWAATLQEAFRLYFLGMIPQRTATADGRPSALAAMYRAAIDLDSTPMTRTDAPDRLAKGATALRWAAGRDPFADYALHVPNDFQAP
jgi:hypothetical protein